MRTIPSYRSGRPCRDPGHPRQVISYRVHPTTVAAIEAAAARARISRGEVLDHMALRFLTKR